MSSAASISRRNVVAALGIAGALPATIASAAAPAAARFASSEYTVKKGDVPLYMYRKRLADSSAAAPVLFLVHGSSISSRPSFDLTVPGKPGYSFMEVFARLGYDVWTMDHENYGRSGRTQGNSDIKSGVADLEIGVEHIVRETGQQRINFSGESSGSLRAGAYAMARPERVARLVMAAPTYKGTGSPTLTERAKQLEFYRTHNRRPRGRDMIASIFTRDKPGTADPAVAEALADAEMPFGAEVPTGTYLDMTANLPVVDPTQIKCPVMLARGEFDGIATEEDLWDFFRQLPNGDRQFVVLPGLAHSLNLGLKRQLFFHAMQAFLSAPSL